VIELLNAVNLNLMAFSTTRFASQRPGFTVFVITVAAAEAAVVSHRPDYRKTVDMRDLTSSVVSEYRSSSLTRREIPDVTGQKPVCGNSNCRILMGPRPKDNPTRFFFWLRQSSQLIWLWYWVTEQAARHLAADGIPTGEVVSSNSL